MECRVGGVAEGWFVWPDGFEEVVAWPNAPPANTKTVAPKMATSPASLPTHSLLFPISSRIITLVTSVLCCGDSAHACASEVTTSGVSNLRES